jgi:RNA-directed DNA polymerase
VSSGSKAGPPSNRNGSWGGGVARSTEEAGQRPQREGVAQGNAPGDGNTAAPEAEVTVSTKLAGLVARARKEACLTNVMQYVDEGLLRLAFRSVHKGAAPGVDGQSYEAYAEHLDQNLRDLYGRLKAGRYRALAVRRVYIPKEAGGQRPLGISTVEDRLVQKAVAWVLGAVYEQDFLDCSHGFRPGRSALTALHQLREGMMQHGVRAVVEVDVVGFFDHVQHDWLRQFLRHRVNDGGLLRLVGKWLAAGVMEHGVVTRTADGVPQGVRSPPCYRISTCTTCWTNGSRGGSSASVGDGPGSRAMRMIG